MLPPLPPPQPDTPNKVSDALAASAHNSRVSSFVALASQTVRCRLHPHCICIHTHTPTHTDSPIIDESPGALL